MYKSMVRRILFGILFIGLGVAVIGQVAGAWDLRDYSHGWWALFIIVPGLASIITSGFEFWNVGLVVIGCWLYGDANNFFGEKGISWLWLLGIMLIILGIKVIFRVPHDEFKRVHVRDNSNESYTSYHFGNRKFNDSIEDYPKYNCVFSNLNISNKSQNLKGGEANSVFGKMVIDLREVNIQNNIVFETSSVFGSLDVIIPKSLPIRLDITPVFGTYHNFASNASADINTPCLELKGAAVFGKINIY